MDVISDILLIFVIYITISLLWMLAEKMIYGAVTPRSIDSVIALVLTVSLNLNIK